MKIVYFGSPAISALVLAHLHEHTSHDIVLVVTQPDRPAGKTLSLTPTPVKAYALSHRLEVFDNEITERAKDIELIQKITNKKPDIAILFAYSRIIKTHLLNAFPFGFWNIHPSLLPLYRGPSPTIMPLLLGDDKTGVSIIQLNEQLDAGLILGQSELRIKSGITRNELETELTQQAAKMLIDLLSHTSDITPLRQNETQATYTMKISREDGYVTSDFIQKSISGKTISHSDLPLILLRYYSRNNISVDFKAIPAAMIFDRIFRATTPWPGIWTQITLNNKQMRLKIINYKLNADQTISLLQVQLEGKKVVDFSTFIKAYNIKSL